VDIDGTGDASLWARLWGESLGRIVVAIPPHQNTKFLEHMRGVPKTILGQVTAGSHLHIVDGDDMILSADVEEMTTSWQGTLDLSKEVSV